MMEFEKIGVVGLGYIGLPTAAAIATQRRHVLGIDVNAEAVETINQGKIHIVEPELDVAVQAAVSRGYLRASLDPEACDAFLIAVPTPFMEGHQPDLSYIEAAARSIAPVLKAGDLIILESTSPVGATEKLCGWIADARPDLTLPHTAGEASDLRVAHCPERVLPGQVMFELTKNDRVIGGVTAACADAAASLYEIFVRGECVKTNARTAEMCKLTENAMRDVNIAFANELSIICDQYDIDVWELITLANRHPRINILQPGPGVGGHCIAVDPWFIISQTPEIAPLMTAARLVNDGKPTYVLDQVRQMLGDHLSKNPSQTAADVTIGCFGLAFKADIDDLRESPALDIAIEIATSHPGKVLVAEPYIEELPDAIKLPNVRLVPTEAALAEAHVMVLLVDHRQFRTANPAMSGRPVIDTRGIWPDRIGTRY